MRLLIVVCILLVNFCTSFPALDRSKDVANAYSDINIPDDHGFTQLMKASSDNDLETVKNLIDKGAEVDQEFKGEGLSTGNTALFFAAKHGNDEVIKVLLSKGADINHANEYGENALFQFSTAGVTEVLLAAGIKVNSRRYFPTITALLSRYDGEHSEKLKILQLLINSGAKVDNIVTDGNIRYDKHYYPILYATSEEEIDILVAAGANINSVGRDNESLLYKLIDRMASADKAETTETVLHMLHHYPQIDLELEDGRFGITPLFRCLILESKLRNTCFGDPHGKDIGHALVAKGANVHFRPMNSPQCLLFAVEEDLFLAAKRLWLAGADNDLPGPSEYHDEELSPVSAATGLIEELFNDVDPESFGSVDEFDLTNSPNKLNSKGQTAIFVAAKFNYLDYLEKEVEPAMESQKSKQLETFDLEIPSEVEGVKYTPLMAALDGNNELVAEWLIKWGATCKSTECIAKAVKTVSDPLDKATDISWPFKLLFESKVIPIDYISPDGESLLMMAAQHENYELLKYYFKNVQHPVELNTKTGQSLLEIVGDKMYRIVISLKLHLNKTLPTVSEDHCGICLQGWEDDIEDVPKQGVPYWCAGRGHVYHYDCAAGWEKKTCPLCTAEIKEPEDLLNFPVSKNDMEG